MLFESRLFQRSARQASRGFIARIRFGLALACATLVPAMADAQTFQSLFSFKGPDGTFPMALVANSVGNVYGVTSAGGNVAPCPAGSQGPYAGCGVLFSLSAGSHPNYSLLYSFTSASDGSFPHSIALEGNALFGAAKWGGISNSTTCQSGCGTVFEYNLTAKTFQIVHTFTGGAGGNKPQAVVTFDKKGVLYGTTEGGGSMVYRLSPPLAGLKSWTFTQLTQASLTVGRGNLTADKSGNVYGVANNGAACFLYELSPSSTGFTETVLHTFPSTDCVQNSDAPAPTIYYPPSGTPILYGATHVGGTHKAGLLYAFDLAHKQYSPLYSFSGTDGAWPNAVAISASGTLYGATFHGGNTTKCPASASNPAGCGTVFAFDLKKQSLKTLHVFSGSDGAYPGIILGPPGVLYGATVLGGNLADCKVTSAYPPGGCGTIFKISGLAN